MRIRIIVLLWLVPCLGIAKSSYVDRLTLTGQIWGYLKYHHTAACTINWDDVLFSALDAQVSHSTETQFNRIVRQLFIALGENKLGDAELPLLGEEFQINPDKDWMRASALTAENRDELRILESTFRPYQSCYISAGESGEPVFNLDRQYYSIGETSRNHRLLALFRLWNIVNYFYPGKPSMSQDWSQVLNTYVGRMLKVEDELAYHRLMQEFVAEVDDTRAQLVSWRINRNDGTAYLPIHLELIEGKNIVTQVLPELPIQPGDELLALDGVSVNRLRELVEPYVSASNEEAHTFATSRLLEQGHNRAAVLRYQRDGKVYDTKVRRTSFKRRLLAYNPDAIWQRHQLAECELGYVDMGRLKSFHINLMMEQLGDTDGIVFDLRNDANETLGRLVDYLFDRPVEVAHFYSPRLDYPGTTKLSSNRVGQGTASPYAGRVLILFDERTTSDAEYTVMGLEQHPRAVKIGSRTQAADLDQSWVFLPGQLRAHLSGRAVYYPDGTPTQRIGMVPDVFQMPTVEGVRSQADEMLEVALNCDNVLNPDWPQKLITY